MGFQTDVSINYDPHHIIYIVRQINKNKPFENNEIAGIPKTANWLDYPHETRRDVDMQDDFTYSVKEVSSLQTSPSSMVPAEERITPITSCFEKTNKRDLYDAMDREEKGATRTPTKKKIEETGQLVQVTEVKGKKNQMNIKCLTFQVKEYAFSETPIDSTSQFSSRDELFDKYKDAKEVASDEALKLYVDVRKISSKDVSLVIIRDHTQNTLNMEIATKNKVVE